MLSAFNVVGEPRLHEEASMVSFDPIAPPSPTRLIYPTLAQRLTPADVHQFQRRPSSTLPERSVSMRRSLTSAR
jgi:hypothetical protein